jgi:hypothetical protein
MSSTRESQVEAQLNAGVELHVKSGIGRINVPESSCKTASRTGSEADFKFSVLAANGAPDNNVYDLCKVRCIAKISPWNKILEIKFLSG